MNSIAKHYDMLVDENNDPVHDPKPLRDYMDKWDGQKFIDKMALDKTKTVLEIGVGTGRLAVKVVPLCSRFVGLDISLKTIVRARQNLERFENVSLICDDFLNVKLEETFDVIYSSLTFMHIKEKQKAILKASQLLKDNGIFALSIDKNPSNTIDSGVSKISIFPDNPTVIENSIIFSRLTILEKYETEFAHIFISRKK